MLPKKKTPLLREDLPDLDFWVGKPIAPGRPSRKSYLNLKTKFVAPVSSWIAGLNEDVDYLYDGQEEELELLRSSRGGEGTDAINEVLGAKTFNYPKPPSLLTALLRQATQRNDLVLDFFAGSGTTAQAVLTLNAEDGGDRQFILVSSTEAPPNDPDRKNLCRDVCAERVRRVMHGYRGQPGAGGGFAYIRLQRIAPADVRYELDAERAWNTLYLRLTAAVQPWPNQRLNVISQNGESAWVLCPAVDETTLSELQALPANKLVVYSDRPTTVAEALADGKTVESQSWREAASLGQGGK